MPNRRTFSLPAFAVAILTCVALVVAGTPIWLVVGIALIWSGTLWLAAPTPEIPIERIDPDRVSSDAITALVEAISQPLLVLEGTRIIMANPAAIEALGAHVIGQDARIGLRHPDAMRLTGMSHGETVIIPGFTGGRSLWQLTRRNIEGDRWVIELTDRTAESDVSRAHTDFVANASHELRTPLASIIGYAETLSDGSEAIEPETRLRFLAIVQREAQRMLALVEDLMTLSHVEAEKHDRPGEELDLAALAARVVAEVSSLRGKERVELVREKEPVPILADASQLEQVLRNLIDNALKYGADDQPVKVTVVQEKDGARLAVMDRGPGIAPEHIPHLTRRFYRTDPGRSRASGGTGLGLAIVKHIVERHRAQLEISSIVGKGTTVEVTFPPLASGDNTAVS